MYCETPGVVIRQFALKVSQFPRKGYSRGEATMAAELIITTKISFYLEQRNKT